MTTRRKEAAARLVGRRFTADLTVLSVAGDKDRTVTVLLRGEHFKMSLEELETMIDVGFLKEANPEERRA